MSDVGLTTSQRRLMKKLAAGWYLDVCGREGYGGWCWTEGRKGFCVTISDMNFLYCASLIEHEHVICDYRISQDGRKALENNQ